MKTCTDKKCTNQHDTRFKLCPICRRQRRARWHKMQGSKSSRPYTQAGYQMSADEFELMQDAAPLREIDRREAAHWTGEFR